MPFWLLAMVALCGSAAVVFFDAAAIVCCMRNFPNERGNSAGTILQARSRAKQLAFTYRPTGPITGTWAKTIEMQGQY